MKLIQFLLIFVAIFWSKSVSGELESVSLVFRHGARTPHNTYPNDIHKGDDFDGLGIGALTSAGIQMMFDLGARLKTAYKCLFAEEGTFRNYNLQAQSSEVERALMSGLSFLAGFYPPVSTVNPLPLNWQPVPIYSIPKNSDYLIQPTACTKLNQLLGKLMTKLPSDLERMLIQDKEMMDTFQRNSGYATLSFNDFLILFDTLKIHKDLNMTLPSWFKPQYWDRHEDYLYRLFDLYSETEEMKILRSGPLFTKIVDEMNAVASKGNPKRISIFSGHDTTVASFARALNIQTQIPRHIDYGATLALELHRNGRNLEVKIRSFANWKSSEPTIVKIPKCPQPCFLETFKNVYKHLIVSNIEELC